MAAVAANKSPRDDGTATQLCSGSFSRRIVARTYSRLFLERNATEWVATFDSSFFYAERSAYETCRAPAGHGNM